MAAIAITESDLQDAIHASYEGNSSTPSSTSDDYLTRRILMNSAINRWENNLGTMWNELWTNTTLTSTGATLTISTGVSTYAAPTMFKFPGGWVKIYNGTTLHKTYRVIKPEQAQKYQSEEYAYFRGDSANGHTLVLNPAPGADMNGFTITYDFYKKATAMANTTDTPEMSDPYYIVWMVVSELYKADNNINLYQSALSEAEERLKQMAFLNTTYAHYQDMGIEDNQTINSGSGFGL